MFQILVLILIAFQTIAWSQTRQTLPQRIVSCSLASDDILLQLLTEPDQRKRIVAVSTLADDSNYSNILQDVRNIPHRTGANIEHVVSLKPDLIVAASFNQPEFISLLKKLKNNVHIMEGFDSLADLRRHTQELGTLLGEGARASHLVSKMNKDLVKLKQGFTFPVKPKLLILYPNGMLVGKKTLLDDGLSAVGLVNLASQRGIIGWQKISEEALLAMSPDWVLSPGEEKDRENVLASFAKSPALKQMQAIQRKKVILLPTALFGDFSFRIIDSLQRVLSTIQLAKN